MNIYKLQKGHVTLSHPSPSQGMEPDGHWLELLDIILFSVHIAKHPSTKFTPFHMMYKRDTDTPFEFTDNQRDGNAVPPSLSGESMTIDYYVGKMENIYQSMLAKDYINIKKL